MHRGPPALAAALLVAVALGTAAAAPRDAAALPSLDRRSRFDVFLTGSCRSNGCRPVGSPELCLTAVTQTFKRQAVLHSGPSSQGCRGQCSFGFGQGKVCTDASNFEASDVCSTVSPCVCVCTADEAQPPNSNSLDWSAGALAARARPHSANAVVVQAGALARRRRDVDCSTNGKDDPTQGPLCASAAGVPSICLFLAPPPNEAMRLEEVCPVSCGVCAATSEPTATPTATPTAAPTPAPTAEPTPSPTAAPTATPTAAPTATPTATPTAAPTGTPTLAPTDSPTVLEGAHQTIQDSIRSWQSEGFTRGDVSKASRSSVLYGKIIEHCAGCGSCDASGVAVKDPWVYHYHNYLAQRCP